MKTNFATIILLFSTLFSNSLLAQNYRLNSPKDNVVKVLGTSNVHDWTMTANDPLCEAEFGAVTGDYNIPKNLTSLSFSVNAKSLKSEHASMDTRTYKTIKADAFPKINFKLIKAELNPVQKNKFNIKATGTLTIAGVSKTIAMVVSAEVNADNTISCTGTQKIQLTDYSIQPPSFMLGAMKVGNDLSIQFSLNFKK
jgi:polyisoprenoid-binding protein YceI